MGLERFQPINIFIMFTISVANIEEIIKLLMVNSDFSSIVQVNKSGQHILNTLLINKDA